MIYLTTIMALTVLMALKNIEDNPHVPYSIRQVSGSGRFDQPMQVKCTSMMIRNRMNNDKQVLGEFTFTIFTYYIFIIRSFDVGSLVGSPVGAIVHWRIHLLAQLGDGAWCTGCHFVYLMRVAGTRASCAYSSGYEPLRADQT